MATRGMPLAGMLPPLIRPFPQILRDLFPIRRQTRKLAVADISEAGKHFAVNMLLVLENPQSAKRDVPILEFQNADGGVAAFVVVVDGIDMPRARHAIDVAVHLVFAFRVMRFIVIIKLHPLGGKCFIDEMPEILHKHGGDSLTTEMRDIGDLTEALDVVVKNVPGIIEVIDACEDLSAIFFGPVFFQCALDERVACAVRERGHVGVITHVHVGVPFIGELPATITSLFQNDDKVVAIIEMKRSKNLIAVYAFRVQFDCPRDGLFERVLYGIDVHLKQILLEDHLLIGYGHIALGQKCFEGAIEVGIKFGRFSIVIIGIR